MLQNIRDNVQGVFAKIIIAIIIIPFAFFGIESLVGGGGGPASAAEVNGEKLTEIEIRRGMNLQRQQLLTSMGEAFDPSLIDEARLRASVIESLINKELLIQKADKAGVGISEVVIDQQILAMPQFQQDGRFQAALYENLLRSNGFTPQTFKESMAEDSVINQLNQGLSSSDFVTDTELASIVAIVKEKRSFRFMTLPVTQVQSELNLSDTDYQAFYENNLDKFQREQQVKLAYIEVNQSDFFQPADEAEVRNRYEKELEDFAASTKRRVSHILLELNDRSEQEAIDLANSLKDKLANGEDFADLAKSSSDDIGSSADGGDLGYTEGDTFPEEFEEALAKLQLNEVSEPVVTDAGVHLIKATEIEAQSPPSFEERQEAIALAIQQSSSEAEFVRTVEDLKDIVFNSEDLAGPAEELSLEVQATEWFGQSTAEGVFASPQLLTAIFSNDVLQDGNNSEVLELSPERYIVVRVLEKQPQQAIPFDEVKDEIIAELQRQKTAELLSAKASDAIQQLSNDTDLKTYAGNNGYEVQDKASLERTSVDAGPDLLEKVFQMSVPPAGGVVYGFKNLLNGDVAIIELYAIEQGKLEELNQVERRAIVSQLQRNRADQTVSGLLRTLRDAAEITVL